MANNRISAVALLALLAGLAVSARADDDAMCHTGVPLVSAATVSAMQVAESTYAGIVRNGGWAVVPGVSMQKGDRSPGVRLLRLRLQVEGDLPGSTGFSTLFDDRVEAAVKRFQARYGVPVTGILDQYTIRTMNVPAEVRLQYVQASLQRLLAAQREAGGAPRRVTVNIPAAQIEAVENGRVAGQYRATAGSPARPSPELSMRITEVNFHPGWTVPPQIVREDLIPRMRADPGYLTRSGFEVLDARGKKVAVKNIDWNSNEPLRYTYRVAPGSANPLGSIRLNTPNSQSVYMHDTPSQKLFSRSIRFLSSGCVRVQGIEKLTAWLLDEPPARVNTLVEKSGPRTVRLEQPVPVQWVYLTAWSTPDNVTCFRPDIYNRMNTAVSAR
ncbi:MAG TPA: L,D-transpeptidase family protein [Alphaproteobacteria bacterium]|nr:L,D-transpeptidase family protein [Alphaproteobacteria bacterium]